MPSPYSLSHMLSRGNRARAVLVLVTVLALFWSIPTAGLAERITSNLVLIRSEDVITEDLYTAGNRVLIEGRIEGDLMAAASDEIVISGEVTGSVMGIADRIEISGVVGGSVRAVAREVVVFQGEIGDDLITATGSLNFLDDSKVGRDAIVWAQEALFGGEIGRNLEGGQNTLILSGVVGGNVDVSVNEISARDLTVGGDLKYRSDQVGEITADVGGSIIQSEPVPPNIEIIGFLIMLFVLGWLFSVGLGLLARRLAPNRSRKAVYNLSHRPIATLLTGLGVIFSPFLFAIFAGAIIIVSPVAVWAPLLIIFIPIFLLLLLLALPMTMIATVPVATWVGSRILRRRSDYAAYLMGMGIWLAVFFIPFLGQIATILALWAGLGAWWAPGGPKQKTEPAPTPRTSFPSAHTT